MTEEAKQKVRDLIEGMTPEELHVLISEIDTVTLHTELMNRAVDNERKLQQLKEVMNNA